MHDSYEDVTPGEMVELGSTTVTRAEIIEFAEQYDPQPFHLGDAPESMFGGIVASGWHTASLTMRLLVDGYLSESQVCGAVGIDELRWPTPVRPGDTLSATLTLGEKEEWDADRGLVHQEVHTENGDGETVQSLEALVLYPRRG